MKKILTWAVIALSVFMVSCSSDSDSPSEPFFNLNVGSKWVYKRYNYNLLDPGVYTDSGITDSVKVEEIVNLNGIDFAKISHKMSFPATQSSYTKYCYERVNAAGYLVGYNEWASQPLPDDLSTIDESSGQIFHPGEDLTYQNTETYPFGTLFSHALGATMISVEGNTFNAMRVVTDYTPAGTTEVTRTVFTDYEHQTGMVKAQFVNAVGNDGYEDRLVSYQLN